MKKAKMEKAKMEKTPKARAGGQKMKSDLNEEPVGTINKKHFGHVTKVANALHGSDPFKHEK